MKLEYASYRDARGKRKSLLLDLYLPLRDTKPNPPLLIYVAGGGWLIGSRSTCPGAMIAERGYALACIDYRPTDIATFPAQINDVKAAIRWLRANYGRYHFDGNHIGIWGDSAGGHLSALAGTSGNVPEVEGSIGIPNVPSNVQAVVDWYGPTDFNAIPLAFNEPIPNPMRDDFWLRYKDHPWYGITYAVTLLLGGPVGEHQDLVRLANPLTWIDPTDPPFLVYHGEPDNVVPVSQSDMFVSALQGNGVGVEYVRPGDRGHTWADPGGAGYSPWLIDMTLGFFDRVLKQQ